jgi:hypothetical protein
MRSDTDAYILGILERDREYLVQQMTEAVISGGQVPGDRETVERLLYGILGVLAEWLGGQSTEVRTRTLEVDMPEVARVVPWRMNLREGLPCWGLLIGMLAVRSESSRQPALIHRLAQIQGQWWADVWEAMYPVYKEQGEV